MDSLFAILKMFNALNIDFIMLSKGYNYHIFFDYSSVMSFDYNQLQELRKESDINIFFKDTSEL